MMGWWETLDHSRGFHAEPERKEKYYGAES